MKSKIAKIVMVLGGVFFLAYEILKQEQYVIFGILLAICIGLILSILHYGE